MILLIERRLIVPHCGVIIYQAPLVQKAWIPHYSLGNLIGVNLVLLIKWKSRGTVCKN